MQKNIAPSVPFPAGKSNLAFLSLYLVAGLGTTSPAYAQVQQAWVVRTNGNFNALKMDSAGNVYVTGWSSRTIKYDANGNQLWAARGGLGAALDSTGNLFVMDAGNLTCRQLCDHGQCFLHCTFDFVTTKYDSTGSRQWEALYDGFRCCRTWS